MSSFPRKILQPSVSCSTYCRTYGKVSPNWDGLELVVCGCLWHIVDRNSMTIVFECLGMQWFGFICQRFLNDPVLHSMIQQLIVCDILYVDFPYGNVWHVVCNCWIWDINGFFGIDMFDISGGCAFPPALWSDTRPQLLETLHLGNSKLTEFKGYSMLLQMSQKWLRQPICSMFFYVFFIFFRPTSSW